jgi:hypothetical protein
VPRQDPGVFMVETIESALPVAARQRIPQAVETGAAKRLAVGYGLTFGAPGRRGGRRASDLDEKRVPCRCFPGER